MADKTRGRTPQRSLEPFAEHLGYLATLAGVLYFGLWIHLKKNQAAKNFSHQQFK